MTRLQDGQMVVEMTGKRRIDRITTDTYLGDLSSKSLDDVRAMRDDCLEEETVLSYERRLLQARMDILRAELDRRRGGGASLLERLPAILADEGPHSPRGAFTMKDPVLDFDRPKRRVERLISDDTLANLPALSEQDVDAIILTLESTEREISELRKAVQGVLDQVSAEIGRRYKSGEADPAERLSR